MSTCWSFSKIKSINFNPVVSSSPSLARQIVDDDSDSSDSSIDEETANSNADNWKELEDDKGKTYWKNIITRESTYHIPQCIQVILEKDEKINEPGGISPPPIFKNPIKKF